MTGGILREEFGNAIRTIRATPFLEAAMNPLYIGWDIHRKFSKVTLAEKREDG
jgi:hypothetical protein